jgi:hypothetical protein
LDEALVDNRHHGAHQKRGSEGAANFLRGTNPWGLKEVVAVGFGIGEMERHGEEVVLVLVLKMRVRTQSIKYYGKEKEVFPKSEGGTNKKAEASSRTWPCPARDVRNQFNCSQTVYEPKSLRCRWGIRKYHYCTSITD